MGHAHKRRLREWQDKDQGALGLVGKRGLKRL